MTDNTEFDAAAVAELDDGFTKAELQAAADQFGVETKKTFNKGQLVEALLTEGVDAALVRGANEQTADDEPDEADFVVDEVPTETEADDDEELVLVRMIRANNTYQIRGYTFKSDHPFALVSEKDADYLVEKDGGFRVASPKEAKEYYS